MNTREVIEAAKQLTAIPSVADNPPALKDAVSFIATMLAGVPGITVEQLEHGNKPSLLAYRGPVRPREFDVLLHGHVDVAPGRPEQYQAYEASGRLYGRGVHDMKTAAIIMADVFRRIIATAPYALGLQIVSDEEVGGFYGAQHHLKDGVRTRFAITGEHNFADNVIYNASRGICWLEVTFKGRSAHGGYVWEGDNAVDKAVRFAQAIMEHYPHPDQATWGTSANIAALHTSNTAFNRIPDHASLKIDFRFTAEDSNFKSREQVTAFVRSIDPDATIATFDIFDQAVHVAENNPYLQELAASLAAVTHHPTQFDWRPAASDGRHFAMLGMDVVEYGLTGNGPHSDNEYIEIDSIPVYTAVLEKFLTSPALTYLAGKTTKQHTAGTKAPAAVH